MIYKEYCALVEAPPTYLTGGSYEYQKLFAKLKEGWEIIGQFTHRETSDYTRHDPSNGSSYSKTDAKHYYVTFILGRNEAPGTLYGRE